MKKRLIVALDGHDGAGKTTLAKRLADRLVGTAVRPFSGETGLELLNAGENNAFEKLLKIGPAAIEKAVSGVPGNGPVVLDRGWMTVASFFPDADFFFANWHTWIPTAVCWADLKTTMSRLEERPEEAPQLLAWHEHYLAVYLELAGRSDSMVLRTDELDIVTCINELVMWSVKLR